MRHQSSGRRSRNRGGSNNRRGPQNSRSQVFDSNGPEVRIRGTANQIHEKYMALARDAAGSGDRILEESYLQHAEHYQRIINSWQDEWGEERGRDHRHVGRENGSQRDEGADEESEESLALPASIIGADTRKEQALENA